MNKMEMVKFDGARVPLVVKTTDKGNQSITLRKYGQIRKELRIADPSLKGSKLDAEVEAIAARERDAMAVFQTANDAEQRNRGFVPVATRTSADGLRYSNVFKLEGTPEAIIRAERAKIARSEARIKEAEEAQANAAAIDAEAGKGKGKGKGKNAAKQETPPVAAPEAPKAAEPAQQ